MPSATNCAEGGTWQGEGLGLRVRAGVRDRLRSARRPAPLSRGRGDIREIFGSERGEKGERKGR